MQVRGEVNGPALLEQVREWAHELGFSQIGVSDVDLSHAEEGLKSWLHNGWHGSMAYMARHGLRRARPAELVPGTVRVISARMDYLPRDTPEGWQRIEFDRLDDPRAATVSAYARGRDYHKVLRARLQRLADRLADAVGPLGHRVFTDSAPVLEVEIASRSGIGWRGKHTLALSRDAGSMFFVGEIFVDLPLPLTPPVDPHCGSCSACIDVCPTRAIVAPGRLDARRCISYLTIENRGPIPIEFRRAIGNRIFGCDDCQLVCPWNRHATPSTEGDFAVRIGLDRPSLVELFGWSEGEWVQATEGMALRRVGYAGWLRNVAVALGNAPRSAEVIAALRARADHENEMVREHVAWALEQQA
jgi:epoxyqueuosine reductase